MNQLTESADEQQRRAWDKWNSGAMDGGPVTINPNPLAEPVLSLRERVEALPRFDPAAPDSRMLPHMQPTADGLFLARSDVLALFEVPQ